jgi:hypothetical protein
VAGSCKCKMIASSLKLYRHVELVCGNSKVGQDYAKGSYRLCHSRNHGSFASGVAGCSMNLEGKAYKKRPSCGRQVLLF